MGAGERLKEEREREEGGRRCESLSTQPHCSFSQPTQTPLAFSVSATTNKAGQPFLPGLAALEKEGLRLSLLPGSICVTFSGLDFSRLADLTAVEAELDSAVFENICCDAIKARIDKLPPVEITADELKREGLFHAAKYLDSTPDVRAEAQRVRHGVTCAVVKKPDGPELSKSSLGLDVADELSCGTLAELMRSKLDAASLSQVGFGYLDLEDPRFIYRAELVPCKVNAAMAAATTAAPSPFRTGSAPLRLVVVPAGCNAWSKLQDRDTCIAYTNALSRAVATIVGKSASDDVGVYMRYIDKTCNPWRSDQERVWPTRHDIEAEINKQPSIFNVSNKLNRNGEEYLLAVPKDENGIVALHHPDADVLDRAADVVAKCLLRDIPEDINLGKSKQSVAVLCCDSAEDFVAELAKMRATPKALVLEGTPPSFWSKPPKLPPGLRAIDTSFFKLSVPDLAWLLRQDVAVVVTGALIDKVVKLVTEQHVTASQLSKLAWLSSAEMRKLKWQRRFLRQTGKSGSEQRRFGSCGL